MTLVIRTCRRIFAFLLLSHFKISINQFCQWPVSTFPSVNHGN
jgi:hypothetical protein